MAYHDPTYFMMFLPVVLVVYQLMPQKMRWMVLLAFSYVFFYLFSGKLIIYIIGTTLITYYVGLWISWLKGKYILAASSMDRDSKKKLKKLYILKQRAVLTIGIAVLIGVLAYLKYYGFFADNMNSLFGNLNMSYTFPKKDLLLPIGISFYTLQAISYMVDVYWEKITAQHNFGKLALFLSFFPQIMEGPISKYSDTAGALIRCNSLNEEKLLRGSIRILWGLFKKMVIADRLYVMVAELFDNYENYSGVMIAVAAVSYTIQLYMEFSGCMDIVIGSGRLFGVYMPENFRQPFCSKNASEFWRRWHITLGVWLKTYIFYPVSMSAVVKKWNRFAKKHVGKYITKVVASALALLPVWLCNGLWHGPRWSYIFFGIYYFVIILLEIAFEPIKTKFIKVLHINDKSHLWTAVQILKTWIIIFVGELFFRANELVDGMKMFASMFHNFNISNLWNGALFNVGLGRADLLAVAIGCIIVGIVGFIKEKNIDLHAKITSFRLPVRWCIYIGLILLIVIFGAYGPGYQEVDLIYAGF